MLRNLLAWLILTAAAAAAAWGTWRGPQPASERIAAQRRGLRSAAPALAGLLAVGALFGLWRRERVRAGDGYSSPAAAWLGKRALLASACAAGLYAAAPVALDAAWLYAAGVGLAAGVRVYAGNLPVRL